MGDVLRLKRPRQVTIKGAIRTALTEATRRVGDVQAVVIVAIGSDGAYSHRAVHNEDMHIFDVYGRAGAVLDKAKSELLD